MSCSSPLNLVVGDGVFDFSAVSSSYEPSSYEDPHLKEETSDDVILDPGTEHSHQFDHNASYSFRPQSISIGSQGEFQHSPDSAFHSSSTSISTASLESPILSSHLETPLIPPSGEPYFMTHDPKIDDSQTDAAVNVNSYYGSQMFGTPHGAYTQFVPMPSNAFPIGSLQPYTTMYPAYSSTPNASHRNVHFYHPYQYSMSQGVYPPNHSWMVPNVASSPSGGWIMGPELATMVSSSTPLISRPNVPEGIPMTGELFDQASTNCIRHKQKLHS